MDQHWDYWISEENLFSDKLGRKAMTKNGIIILLFFGAKLYMIIILVIITSARIIIPVGNTGYLHVLLEYCKLSIMCSICVMQTFLKYCRRSTTLFS